MDRPSFWRVASLFALVTAIFIAIALSQPARAQEDASAYWLAEAQRQASPARTARLHPAHRTHLERRSRDHGSLQNLQGSPLLSVAARYMGGRNPTGTRGPWCRDFVNYVIRRAGLPLADTSRRARDGVRLGKRVRAPRPGDLAVMRTHITIVKDIDGGRVIGLGGNQCGGRVCVSRYSESRVIAYVRVEG